MSIVLLDKRYVDGTLYNAGDTVTSDAATEAWFVQQGLATFVAAPYVGGGTAPAEYSLDASGNVTGLVAPDGAPVGQLSSITYNSNGTLNTYQCDGVTWTCAYDAAGRLSTETATGGPTRTYTYDASSGLLTSVTEA